MFRARPRTESPSSESSIRGSIGSARVWDERTRTLRGRSPQPAGDGIAPEDFHALVAALVRLTLDKRGGDAARRVEIARELHARLLEQLGERPAPSAAPETESGVPPPALASASAELVHTDPVRRALWLVLDDRLSRLGGPIAARADVRQRLIALCLAHLEAVPETIGASRDELRNLDTLQRRLAKLEHALEETRAALAYVSGLEHVDTGIASIYRFVQGLAPEDPQRERKRDALEGIYRANLALQQPAALEPDYNDTSSPT
jgi:hypothetical protein